MARMAWLDEEADAAELAHAWAGLADPVAECPCCGEVWQYMGSALRVVGWVHEFRHRHHGGANWRDVARVGVGASPGWEPAVTLGSLVAERITTPAPKGWGEA